MYTSKPNFDKFNHEANEYVKEFAEQLGHPGEEGRALILWRSVMHAIRDRIHISESFDLMSQLPMILTGLYVEGWSYSEKPSLTYDSIEEMTSAVKSYQEQYGEIEFDWEEQTATLVRETLKSLEKYLTAGQLEHIQGQLPKEVQEIVPV